MLYLSEILNVKITDSSDQVVGRLKDILIRSKAGVYPPLDFLLVRGKKGAEFCIPYEYVLNLSHNEISLKNIFVNINTLPEPKQGFIKLQKDVLDQQIVDVGGARVVRVNDLKMGQVEDKMCVLGIDISLRGILRRLGMGWLDFFSVLPIKLIDWRKAQPVKRGMLQLDTISQDLTRLHPADLANIVESLNVRQGSKLMSSLDADTAAQVVEEMDPEVKKILVGHLGAEKASKIIDKMSSDEIVDLVQALSKTDAKDLLSRLHNGKLQKLKTLIEYGRDTAGGLMTAEVAAGRPDWTVKEATAEIKKMSPSMRSMLYMYITDKDGVFKGSVSLRRLLTAKPNQTMMDLIKRHPATSTLRVGQKIKDIVRVMTKYNLYTAAVLDEQKRLVGMVTIDDIMRQIFPKA
ncbi:MAG: CBS domain-containing protein [bacterium]|nr:CBS domain-containing protein [bacterium]